MTNASSCSKNYNNLDSSIIQGDDDVNIITYATGSEDYTEDSNIYYTPLSAGPYDVS